jgi:hypothetical protein
VPLPEDRARRAGDPIPDLCRACKTVRQHTVMAVDGQGRVVRVVCDFCRSEHNYRGGGEDREAAPAVRSAARSPVQSSARLASPQSAALPLVSERERTGPPMSTGQSEADLELLLRRILREELGLTKAAPAEKWRGGQLVLRPGRPGLQDKTWPIEAFFHKVVMLRNRLRTLEQQLNGAELPEDLKVRLQSYVTGCYGSLTSFNVLFADEDDQFKGSGGSD